MSTTPEAFAAGQSWTYRAPAGYDTSRLTIGAVVRFQNDRTIICATATDTPVRNTDLANGATNVAFIPMSEAAFRASVISCDDTSTEPANPRAFQNEMKAWQEDPKGMTVFTVPFEGSLDKMIALQMAQIVGQPAA